MKLSLIATLIMGAEQNGLNTIRFSLPVKPGSKYQKSLHAGRAIVMTLAYSSSDDS